jgi:serine/threonine protein kinase
MTDLGCATPIDADQQERQAARRVLNPSTSAPEQFQDRLTFTPATDLWVLGALLYRLRYLRYPYAVPEGNGLPLGVRALNGKLSFPALLDLSGAEVPGSADTVLRDAGASPCADEERLIRPWLARLLEPDPARRYHDAAEAQRDLAAIATQLDARPAMAQAFVAMPFAAEFDPLWRLILSASLASRVRAIRVDQSVTNESIWDEVRDQIESSDIMVAVASPHHGGVPNANVMLEIGYMRALRRPILILTTDPERLPFDLRTQRAIRYQPGAEHGARLHGDLCETLQAVVARLPPRSAAT